MLVITLQCTVKYLHAVSIFQKQGNWVCKCETLKNPIWTTVSKTNKNWFSVLNSYGRRIKIHYANPKLLKARVWSGKPGPSMSKQNINSNGSKFNVMYLVGQEMHSLLWTVWTMSDNQWRTLEATSNQLEQRVGEKYLT